MKVHICSSYWGRLWCDHLVYWWWPIHVFFEPVILLFELLFVPWMKLCRPKYHGGADLLNRAEYYRSMYSYCACCWSSTAFQKVGTLPHVQLYSDRILGTAKERWYLHCEIAARCSYRNRWSCEKNESDGCWDTEEQRSHQRRATIRDCSISKDF